MGHHIRPQLDRMVLVGRLDPEPARARYELPAAIDFVELPFYRTLAASNDAVRRRPVTGSL